MIASLLWRSSDSNDLRPDRAEERTGPEDVGDQTLTTIENQSCRRSAASLGAPGQDLAGAHWPACTGASRYTGHP
jgi:hypothetical protein